MLFKRFRGRPSPTTVIACLALFFAVAGGSAIALQGRNSVDSGDIKPKAVKTSDIANNAVTTRKIKNNHVRTADIQNAQVRPADLAPEEPFHRVGAPGEPPIGNGGEGDCLWVEPFAPGIGDPYNETAFYKNARGEVHLTGFLTSADGPGGDGLCDDTEDRFAFTLPPGYRPPEISAFSNPADTDTAIVIVGTQDLDACGTILPAGTVALSGGTFPVGMVFDQIDFRAAGPGNGLPRRDGVVQLSDEQAAALGLDLEAGLGQ